MLKRLLCLLTFSMLATTFILSQITTSSLTGTVKDSIDEPLVGSTISATHQPSGTRYSTVSQKGGLFSIANMRVGGPYQVVVTYVGYEPQRYNDVYLKLAEPYFLTSVMKKTTSILENVVVATGRRNPILNAHRTGAITNIGLREIQLLPSISRSINDFTRLTPQANGTSVAGGNYRQNNFTIDGSDFNNSFGIGINLPANGSPISVDAIEEISINITPYDIRQSGFIGSAINAITRSGTNTYSGSVYTYFRNEKQQGDKVGKVSFVRPPFEFKQYGVRLGGPIIKNKLFFFFNYESDNQPKHLQTRFAATSAAPFGSSPNIARPTASELDEIRNYLKETYGYETGEYDNYTDEIKRKKILGRIDWNISRNHKLNVRWSQVEGDEPNALVNSRSPLTAFASGAARTDINALWFRNSNYFQGANFYSFAAELNSSFGKKFANTLRGTYTNQNDSRTSTSSTFPFVDILKDGSPFTSFGYEPFTFGNLRKVKMYSFVDNLSWRSGKHNWIVGAQLDFSETINGFQRFGTSYYTFASWSDFTSGVNPQDFGITYSLATNFKQAFPSFKFAQYSAYGQDEIAVNNKFRLTLGLRLDLPTYPKHLLTHPLVEELTFAKGEKLNTGNLPKKQLMWSPRIGFNYDLYGNRSLQIRGGTGIFTGKVPFVWIVSQAGDAGMLQVTQTFVGQANTPGPFNPDPIAYRPSSVPPAGTLIPSTISVIHESFKMPQTWKSSLAIDKRLPWGMILTLEGVFNKDINTAVFRNPNLVQPTPLGVAGYPDNRLIYPNANNEKFINPLTTSGQPSPTGTQAFNTIVLDNGSKGYYFSLTAKVDKQFSKGLFASIAYIKSVANNLFDGNGDQPLTAWQGTANVNGANFPVLGYAGFVVPDRLAASFSYRKEYFKHLATTLSLLYSGSIDGRFSYTYSADLNRDGTNFDLIYIPKDPSEITFTDFTYNGVPINGAQQSEIFFKYIGQDKYLRAHKGQYAERNGAQIPWRNQIDVKVLQDVFMNIGRNRHTVQFSLDIFNFGNLLNSNWGRVKTINASSILVPTNQALLVPGGSVRPTFRLASDRNNPVTRTFRDNVSVLSTYYMQFGLRYLFN